MYDQVNYDDARLFFAARTTISSPTGRQLEHLRDGDRTPAHYAVLAQAKEETNRLKFAKVIRCIDRLGERTSIRFTWAPDLRAFARKHNLLEGATVLRILYAYEQWHPGWPEKGLVEVYNWLSSVDPKLKEIATENGSAAQAFRTGKSPRARKLAASVTADAHVILAEWVRIYNGKLNAA